MRNRTWKSDALTVGLVFAGYYLSGFLMLRFAVMPEGIVTFWPPNAILLAALLTSPIRRWALILTAGMTAEFAIGIGSFSIVQIIGFAVVNAMESLLSAILIRRWFLRKAPYRSMDLRLALSGGAALLFVTTPLAALGGSALYYLNDPSIDYWQFWRIWWFGDALGLLIVTPFLLVWFGERMPREIASRQHRVELAAFVLLLLVAGGSVFLAPTTWPEWLKSGGLMLLFPVWGAIRFGLHGATLSNIVISFLCASGTADGRGPFANIEIHASTTLAVQEYLTTSAILALLLGSAFRQMHWALNALKEEREYLEDRVKERTEELERETRVKDILFSVIAHDLRSPFNIILGMTDFMANRADRLDKAKLVEYANDVHQAARRVHTLLDDLLVWSRIQMECSPNAAAATVLRDEVARSLETWMDDAEKKSIDLKNDLGSDTVSIDPELLQTVLRNLVSNALKFTPSGGEVTLTSRREGDRVRITVTDNGTGIEAERLDGIFAISSEKSTVGTEGETGTGMGLMICKELLDGIGGDISIDSTPGQGTSVSFSLNAIGRPGENTEATNADAT